MIGRVLVDTNILVYAYDRASPDKARRALAVLDELATTVQGALSAQILAEFFVVVTSKKRFANPLTPADAYDRLKSYLEAWPILDLSPLVVLEAARGVRDHQLSYWDAQIWATARLNQIQVVYSEDFNTDAVIEGVRFVNPLMLPHPAN